MWKLYVLRLSDGSLYTGITKDLERRVKEHREGEGSKYVRSRLPCEIVYTEDCEDRSSVLKREAEIKKMCKKRKESLIS
ncbi:MAG: GIY-YIG nuclease family protein [Candidatus Aenigmatarchaeota archaeon]